MQSLLAMHYKKGILHYKGDQIFLQLHDVDQFNRYQFKTKIVLFILYCYLNISINLKQKLSYLYYSFDIQEKFYKIIYLIVGLHSINIYLILLIDKAVEGNIS